MLRSAPGSTREFVRRWIARRELIPFVPALLLCGLWFGGEMVLVVTAVLFPALYLFGRDEAIRTRPSPETDGLTGLPLRDSLTSAADAVLRAAARTGRTTTIFALEIDGFAAIEREYGLHAGEEILRRVSERLERSVREGDRVVRIGGAQFGVMLAAGARNDLEAAIQTATRLQDAVREPILAGGQRLHPECCVGFCLGGRSPAPAVAAALEAALDALAAAQAAGQGSVRAFSRGRTPARAVRPSADASLLSALENGQIRPWFQPQVSTDTGAVSGFEALARWEHPERGEILPEAFVPDLVAAGLEERLSALMLFHGLNALRSWDRAGLCVPTLGLNFGADILRSPSLADRISWEIDRFELRPERLAVEILESVVLDMRDEVVTRTITELARLGCVIDLDDFGTGNAALSALRQLPIRRLKIDRSLVVRIDEDRRQQKLVAGILGLAERLEIGTLAEGVERVGEHAILAQLGCGHVQGFGIARPMPFDETIGWMERHARKLGSAPEIRRHAG